MSLLNYFSENNLIDIRLNGFLKFQFSLASNNGLLEYFYIIKNLFSTLNFIHENDVSFNGTFSLHDIFYNVNWWVLYVIIFFLK